MRDLSGFFPSEDWAIERFADLMREASGQMDVYRLISLLPPSPMRVVLVKRYINFKSFDDVAKDIGYTVRQVHRLHGQALAHILERCH